LHTLRARRRHRDDRGRTDVTAEGTPVTTHLSTTAGMAPAAALALLRGHVSGDFHDIVPDLERGEGCWLVDQTDDTPYLDMTSYFSSAPLGHGDPGLRDPAFEADLLAAARVRPSNPDFATIAHARFVDTFRRVLGDIELPHLFFIDGGALAVENALKIAFDWKAKRTGRRGTGRDWQVLHLQHAFHGRSGYTMSLTNTDPGKTRDFPLFDWPRVAAPAVHDPAEWARLTLSTAETAALAEVREALDRHGDRIACFIYEPIQGEGGDRHLHPRFLRAVQDLCEAHDVLTVADEVQTGGGTVGGAWAYQQLGLRPDLVAFGKKTQVCGVMGGRRLLDVPDHAFVEGGRISSTWGGSLTGMVRAARILELVEERDLFANAREKGAHLLAGLHRLAEDFPTLVSEPRGRGLMAAVTLAGPAVRDEVITSARERFQTLLLPCGRRSVRLRPPLTVTLPDIEAAVRGLRGALNGVPH
jgi:L-lysine 6-transaminase